MSGSNIRFVFLEYSNVYLPDDLSYCEFTPCFMEGVKIRHLEYGLLRKSKWNQRGDIFENGGMNNG